MYRLDDYNYELPEALIAQEPMARRDRSKLLHLNRFTGQCHHYHFDALPELLQSGDLLVINNTRVVPARLYGRKPTGGRVEILILDFSEATHKEETGEGFIATCLLKASKMPTVGQRLDFDAQLSALVMGRQASFFCLRFESADNVAKQILDRGRMPLPPYIKRSPAGRRDQDDQQRYQTVYATRHGAVAAPTAGLHFTPELLAGLQRQQIDIAQITLHVGYGTFSPVRVDDIRDHQMHSETFEVGEQAAAAINRAKQAGQRVVAVGTTCVRTLEYLADPEGRLQAQSGACDLFIFPGYAFKCVDAMITNFHLPRSTLLMLVAAFGGRRQIMSAYREAVRCRYRFYSYGDAMLIAP
jgi:S-adenosylmethionine:tRNA ribosyltransferase-isomerase